LSRDRCSGCEARTGAVAVDANSTERLPRCGRCGSMLRPDVVWFGESLDPSVLNTSFRLASEAAVCLVVGTSAVVHPAASIPISTLQAGGAILEVNLGSTPLSRYADVSLAGRAAEVLPRLLG
jgi:NAD-dependent deacetylase